MPIRSLPAALLHLTTQHEDSTVTPHPLCSLLDPLLHTVRSCAGKYRTDLPALLDSGGTEHPEVEEAMIWYAMAHEPSLTGQQPGSGSGDAEQSPSDARIKWLQEMEYRECVPSSTLDSRGKSHV
jgi:hypothetical protein